MPLVVESTSVATATNASSVSITAPTGITTSDLLVIISSANSVQTAPAGFTSFVALDSGIRTQGFYKIAVLADESAANYVVTSATTNSGVATMLRISGWTTGNPIFDSSTAESTFTDGNEPTTLGQSSISVLRPAGQLLLYIGSFGVTDTSSDFSFAGYSITSTDSNPTWTEVQDSEVLVSSNVVAITQSVAYAITTNTSEITAYSANITESGFSVGTGFANVGLFSIVEPTNANPNVSPIALTTGLTSLEAANSATAEISMADISPTLTSLASKSSSDATQWSNPTKPSSPWTNTPK